MQFGGRYGFGSVSVRIRCVCETALSANTTGNFNKICTYTTTSVVYNLVIMKAIDGLSSETIVQLFYKHNTVDYRLLWDNTQSDYKDHELNAVTWNNLYCKGISAI